MRLAPEVAGSPLQGSFYSGGVNHLKRADQVAGLLLLLLSVYVIYTGLGYGYWVETAPGPGFMPLWLGIALGICSILLILGTLAPDANNARWLPEGEAAKQLFFVVGLSIVTTILTFWVGMVIASGLYMAAVLFYLEPTQKKQNTIISILTPVLVWALFSYWLRVPMPTSPLGF